MPERQTVKNQFRLNRGLNTESNEINFPDGFTTDEQNYELLVDGSRRRRKGLARESGGSLKVSGLTIAAGTAVHSYKWRGVGGDPSKNFIVHQIGTELFFTDDAELISTTYHADTINMRALLVDGTTTQAAQEVEPVQFSHGRGHLFFAGKFIRPSFIEYDVANDRFNVKPISIFIRDFDGIDDGISNQLQPGGAITDEHRYNLRNRGWVEADIATYLAGQSVNPSKAQVWYRGYRRQTDVAFSDLDGVQIFDDAKLAAEQFGQSSAPQGGLFLNPLDTRFSASNTNEGIEVQISTWSMTGNPFVGGVVTVTTATPHGRSNGDFVTISGNVFITSLGGIGRIFGDLDGFHEISNVGASTFDFTLPPNSGLTTFEDQFNQLGQINGNVSLPKSDGKELTVGPAATTFAFGRCWFAGIEDSEWADTIFFSKIAQKPISYGICNQEFDPTNPELNALSSSDGGTIVIPNLGQVKRMIATRTSLLVFSDQGVWEIGGGQRGLFTATGYSVRKLTDDECSSSFSPILIGTRLVFTGPRGIFQIAPNEFTSVLESENISDELIRTLWNDIPFANQQVVQTVYDEALKRIYFLYGDTGDNINQYANALVLDLRVGAWYKFVFNVSATEAILTAYSITDSDSTGQNKKVKWTIQSTDDLDTADLDQTDFVDYDGAESPLPFMVTGHDNLGDFQTRRQAPVITVFQKRTETAFVTGGSGLEPVNESSCLMTPSWDWSDDAISGKVSASQEVYRHVRAFQPAGAGPFEDGYPVVTTRNKVRGRGRALQLRFDGAATFDTHILGFSTNYKVQRKV